MRINKENLNIVGEIIKNSKGTPMKIISVRVKSDITIQFLDEHEYIKEHVNYQNFKKGQVENPYDKTVYGIGYLGDGEHKTWSNGRFTKEYNSWSDMLSRCYADEKGQSAYFNKCTVCDGWLNFQTFCDWYDENAYLVNERLHLDKDILFHGNKIYSPERCLLVPQRINMLFVRHRPNKYDLPEGIGKTDGGNFSTSYNGKSYGVYDTYEKAIDKYIEIKSNAIKNITEEYKSIVPKKVYNSLINYKVDIICNKEYRAA